LFRYLPSLKRSIRVAARDDFESGDFRQADVLRVDLKSDYKIVEMKSDGDARVLQLVAATPNAAYDKVTFRVRASDSIPMREEFFTTAGKKLRTLELSDATDFGGHTRPATLKMTNEITQGRY